MPLRLNYLWAAPLVAVVVGVLAGIVITIPMSAVTFWLMALWTTWIVSAIWALHQRHVSLVFVAVLLVMLWMVVSEATFVVIDGKTTAGGQDFTAATAGALRLATLAQASLLAGAMAVRAIMGSPEPIRPARRRAPGAERLVRRLFFAGILSLLGFYVLSSADVASFNVLTGTVTRSAFEQSASGPVFKYLGALASLMGVSLVVAVMVLTWRNPRHRLTMYLVVGATVGLLGAGGTRSKLFVPLVAAGLVWWKVSPARLADRPRQLLAVAALGLFLVAALVGGLRGQVGPKSLDVAGFIDHEARSGVFSTSAGLVESVPSDVDHLWGSSYVELVILPVPRALWPGKPQAEIHELQSQYLDTRSGVSFATYGEMYANFGYLGVLLGCMALAGLLEALWLRFAATEDLGSVVALACLMPIGLEVLSRGYMAGQLAGNFGILAGAYVSMRWLRRRQEGLEPQPEATGDVVPLGRRG